jgi:hypothetical protein
MRKDDSKMYHKGYGLTNYIEKAMQRKPVQRLYHCCDAFIMAGSATVTITYGNEMTDMLICPLGSRESAVCTAKGDSCQ